MIKQVVFEKNCLFNEYIIDSIIVFFQMQYLIIFMIYTGQFYFFPLNK